MKELDGNRPKAADYSSARDGGICWSPKENVRLPATADSPVPRLAAGCTTSYSLINKLLQPNFPPPSFSIL